jgi:hypothetical protein
MKSDDFMVRINGFRTPYNHCMSEHERNALLSELVNGFRSLSLLGLVLATFQLLIGDRDGATLVRSA